jgi:hypothetical protein
MKKILLAGVGVLAAGAVMAQTITIPYVQSMNYTDALQVIPRGAPVVGNVYATMLQMQSMLFSGSSQRTGATAPALTSCGTSPSIAGSDFAGTVTMGTGSPTGCVITFNTAYSAAPHCVVTSESQLTSFAYSTSATAITTVQTGTSSNKVDYVCVTNLGTGT